MPSAELSEQFLTLLDLEYRLLTEYSRGCRELHGRLVARNWVELEKQISRLQEQALALEKTDREREKLIPLMKVEVQLPETASFAMLLSCFDQKTRAGIMGMKQKIRHSIKLLQHRLQGINRYIDHQSGLFKDLMEEMVPASRGRIYNSRGTASPADNRPLLINHQF